jgi:hypothetical protein
LEASTPWQLERSSRWLKDIWSAQASKMGISLFVLCRRPRNLAFTTYLLPLNSPSLDRSFHDMWYEIAIPVGHPLPQGMGGPFLISIFAAHSSYVTRSDSSFESKAMATWHVEWICEKKDISRKTFSAIVESTAQTLRRMRVT